jgi:sulfur carrier protein
MRTHKGVAAAVDGAVAPKSTWTDVVLHDGAAVELLTAVQGG